MKKTQKVIIFGLFFVACFLMLAVIENVKNSVEYICNQNIDEYMQQECRIYKEWGCYGENKNSQNCKMTKYNITGLGDF